MSLKTYRSERRHALHKTERSSFAVHAGVLGTFQKGIKQQGQPILRGKFRTDIDELRRAANFVIWSALCLFTATDAPPPVAVYCSLHVADINNVQQYITVVVSRGDGQIEHGPHPPFPLRRRAIAGLPWLYAGLASMCSSLGLDMTHLSRDMQQSCVYDFSLLLAALHRLASRGADWKGATLGGTPENGYWVPYQRYILPYHRRRELLP